MHKNMMHFLVAATAAISFSAHAVAQYSDSQIRSYISKGNSIQPDMTVNQVVSIMGQPVREQLVSNSPPQRILVYPLGIVVSFYRSSRTQEWLVTMPTLYGSPLCQREDGAVQKNAIGAEFVETPGTNCIPKKFGPQAPKSAMPAQKTPAKWQLLKENSPYQSGDGVSHPDWKYFYDSGSVSGSGTMKTVRQMESYGGDQRTYHGNAYRSKLELTMVSCDAEKIQQGKSTLAKLTEYYSGEMGTGAVVETTKNEENDPTMGDYFWHKDYIGLITKQVCQ
jgi:hypothetical protein